MLPIRSRHVLLVAALLAGYFILAVTATLRKCTTYDEIAHLTAGHSLWMCNDYRLHGSLSQRWADLPLIVYHPNFPELNQHAWHKSEVWELGRQFFYECDNDPDAMLLQGRIMIALMGVVLGALVYAYARHLFGPAAGLLSLVLFVFCPTLLANGALVTADLPAALFFLASLAACWWAMQEVTPVSLLVSGLVLGGLFLTKNSALLMLPVAGALFLLRVADGRPLPVRWKSPRLRFGLVLAADTNPTRECAANTDPTNEWAAHTDPKRECAANTDPTRECAAKIDPTHERAAHTNPKREWAAHTNPKRKRGLIDKTVTGRLHLVAALAGVFLVQAVIVWAVIWAGFGFRYAALAEATPGLDQLKPGWGEVFVFNFPEPAGDVIRWTRDRRLLPEGYLYWLAYDLASTQKRWAFLNGQRSETGWPWFFPYTFLVKTPLGIFVILVLAGLTVKVVQDRTAWRESWRGFYATAPLWIFLTVYWATAVRSHINIGHRHILPIYPVIYVLAGAAAFWARRAEPREDDTGPGPLRGPARQDAAPPATPWARLVLMAAVAWVALDSLLTWPNYLAFFNRIAGGPRHGYEHLVDSSLDWGQDLPDLKTWLEEEDPDGRQPHFLVYFGTGDPVYYEVDARVLPIQHRDVKSQVIGYKPGIYCISATRLQGLYGPKLDPAPFPVLGASTVGLAASPWGDGPWAAAAALVHRKSSRRSDEETLSFVNNFEKLRLRRLLDYLRRRGEPDDHVNYSILIYRVTQLDLDEAFR